MLPVSTGNGLEALSALHTAKDRGRPFSLVIADCMMPGMDGFELAERIVQDPEVNAHIIMLTSSGCRGDTARCKDLGISAYLKKPVKQSHLFDAIALAMGTASADPSDRPLITKHTVQESKRQLSLLLAEDNAVNRKVASKLLERMGHRVSIAENGREALEAIERSRFDAVLMDVQMPEMDGLEATNLIRDRERSAGGHIPIIAMTARAMQGDREACLKAGMDGYVAKPIKPAELYELLEGLHRQFEPNRDTRRKAGSYAGVLDQEEMLNRVGGDTELLHELVELFLQDYPQLLEQMAQALELSEYENFSVAAHTLKGMVGNFSAEAAANAALNCELIGPDPSPDEAAESLRLLEQEISLLHTALETAEKEHVK
jgi:CheY-like chemotaxis protein